MKVTIGPAGRAVEVCCEDFAAANHSGTDNEGYGRLISARAGPWEIGCDLKPINFCPWCGKAVVHPRDQK